MNRRQRRKAWKKAHNLKYRMTEEELAKWDKWEKENPPVVTDTKAFFDDMRERRRKLSTSEHS